MIRIENLTKSYDTRAGKHYLFEGVSLEIPPGKNVGILGPNGAGKSTFLRILGGIDFPDSGKIRCPYSLSWPLGIAGGFVGHLTGRENCSMVCRAYGLHGEEIENRLEFIKELSGIGKYFEEPIRYYSSGMNGRLNFSLSMAFDFEYFLIDEVTSVGDVQFREKAKAALDEKRMQSKVIMVSHSMGTIRDFCDVGIVLRDGKMQYFEDLDEALSAYFPKPKKLLEEPELDLRSDLDEFFGHAFQSSTKEIQRLLTEFKMAMTEIELAIENAYKIDDEAVFYHRMGNLYLQMGALSQALEAHRKSIYLEEQRLEFYPSYCACLVQRGLKEEALEVMDRVLEWNPHFTAIWSQKAMLCNQSGDLSTALLCGKKTVSLEPENGSRWHMLAAIQYTKGLVDDALKSQIRALDLEDSNPNHWELMSKILCGLGHWQRAATARFKAEELKAEGKSKQDVEKKRIENWISQLNRLFKMIR